MCIFSVASQCPRIESLVLNGCCGARTATVFPNMLNLATLCLQHGRVTASCLDNILMACPNLTLLDISYNKKSGYDILPVVAIHGKNLITLDVSHSYDTLPPDPPLRLTVPPLSLLQLTTINIFDCSFMTCKALCELSNAAPNVQSVTVTPTLIGDTWEEAKLHAAGQSTKKRPRKFKIPPLFKEEK